MTPLNADEILDLIADRDCRVALAAMIASCDGAVRRHRYGDDPGGGWRLNEEGLTGRGTATNR
jgi:hypothetical protein